MQFVAYKGRQYRVLGRFLTQSAAINHLIAYCLGGTEVLAIDGKFVVARPVATKQ